jgi:hypothetical protein
MFLFFILNCLKVTFYYFISEHYQHSIFNFYLNQSFMLADSFTWNDLFLLYYFCVIKLTSFHLISFFIVFNLLHYQIYFLIRMTSLYIVYFDIIVLSY